MGRHANTEHAEQAGRGAGAYRQKRKRDENEKRGKRERWGKRGK